MFGFKNLGRWFAIGLLMVLMGGQVFNGGALSFASVPKGGCELTHRCCCAPAACTCQTHQAGANGGTWIYADCTPQQMLAQPAFCLDMVSGMGVQIVFFVDKGVLFEASDLLWPTPPFDSVFRPPAFLA